MTAETHPLCTSVFKETSQSPDMRMLLDRLLIPAGTAPLIRDFLESLRECKFGETQIALFMLKRHFDVEIAHLQESLSLHIFLNAAHSIEPFVAFQFLSDSGFCPIPCASEIMEHLVLGQYFETNRITPLLSWFQAHAGMIKPESKAAWKCLEANYPQLFAINLSKYEAVKLDQYIRSQSLEVREVSRL